MKPKHDKGRSENGVGNTPEMWRQTVYFFVIPLAAVLALLWLLGS